MSRYLSVKKWPMTEAAISTQRAATKVEYTPMLIQAVQSAATSVTAATGKAVLCKRLCAALRAKRWGDAEELLQNDVIRKRAADYDKQKGFEVHRLRLLLFGTGRNDRVRSAAESGSALLADGADNGHDDRKHDEAAGGTCEQGDAVRLEEVKRDPGKAARAEDLSYRGGDKERRDEARGR